MRLRLPSLLWPALGLAAILLGLAAGAARPSHSPPGDGATQPLIALSLLHDRDLAWDERDLARAYRHWNAGPDGLVLSPSPDGTLRYARPLAYPLALLPFLPLGPSGPAVLNTLLLLAMLSTMLWLYTTTRSGSSSAPPEVSSPSTAEPRGPGREPLSQGRLTPRPLERDARLDRPRAGAAEASADPHPLTSSAGRPLGEGLPPRPAAGATARPLGEGLPPRPAAGATARPLGAGRPPRPAAGGWIHQGGPLLVFIAGSFLLSYTLAHAWRPEPTLLEAAGVFFPFALALALDRRPHPLPPSREASLALAAGLLLGAAVTSAPPLAVLALAPATALALGRRPRALAGLALGAILAAGLLAAAEHRLAGRWSAWQPGVEHLTFRGAFPGDRATGPDAAVPAPPRPSPVRSAGRLARESWWLLAGRHGGALPYFPFAVLAVVLCFAAPVDRARALLLAGGLALAAWALLAPPAALAGGDLFAGHRWLAVLAPALALLPAPAAFGRREPDSGSSRRGLGASGASGGGRLVAWGAAVALLAAAVWTVPALAAALAGSIAPAPAPGDGGGGAAATAHLRLASFRALPLELSLLPRLPGYSLRSWGRGTWAFPAAGVYAAEGNPHGVWLRGGAAAELVLASPEPLGSIAFTAFSPLPGNVLTVDAGGEELIVRFDSPGKRAGVPVALPVRPAARSLGFFPRAPGDAFYRVRVTSSEGWVPARSDPGSADPRYLSTFLSFTGGPP